MTNYYQFDDGFMALANYCNPKIHRHLASHLIITTGACMNWKIEGKAVSCKGIVIGPNVRHVSYQSESESHMPMPRQQIRIPEQRLDKNIVFLFSSLSMLEPSIYAHYLKDKEYSVLPDEMSDKVVQIYNRFQKNVTENWTEKKLSQMCGEILACCKIHKVDFYPYEERVMQIIMILRNMDMIPSNIMDMLSSDVGLSKSRISHLFKEETHITLHSYVALLKMSRTVQYLKQGYRITQASMMAGFDSPSHCAATAQRMFGISLSNVIRAK